ncbi:MAG: SpoIIE family protein phosphatase [Tepidibacter sp.]|jgi:serine/threonine protein phosphatase PrpC|uniref:PP2C family protein-serine/threonine phosphatase n=1 Tax=Tepidibacter sp. TaxID=2529387 RepID=UPI0025D9B0B5|nr:protein phosphatase 2C domain-containing protein [Tepidibacter sp.]MCT4509792.1 SpoIIE family protein phosphatase [Tepidibacter sp.]
MNELVILISIIFILIVIREILNLKTEKMNLNKLEIGKASFIGDREFQEDSMDIAYSKDATLTVLSDGRGKNKAGKLSSVLSTKIFVELFKNDNSISNINYFFRRAFNITNREILKNLDDNQGGASIVCSIIVEDVLHYALVGNTMIAVFRNNELISLSEGHTANVLAKKGFYEGKISKQHAIWALKEKRLLNYVGQDGFKDIEIHDVPVKLKEGDIIVLMSDGIHNYVGWNDLEYILKQKLTSNQIAQNIVNKLEDIDIEDKDNGSVIVIKYK